MNGVKSQPLESPPASVTPQISGKLVIIGILTVAITGAAVSWYFRYNATHRAAKFWGPEAATLIRDAPQVTLFRKPSGEVIRLARNDPKPASFDGSARDISHAHGLVHLRTALLEDRSFEWAVTTESSPKQDSDISYWVLSFYDPENGKTALIMFAEDCKHAWRTSEHLLAYELTNISTEPIAAGLREMFDEFSATPAANPGAKSAAPAR